MALLGYVLEQNERIEKARFWLEQAAEAGNIFGIRRLSYLLMYRDPAGRDYLKAIGNIRSIAGNSYGGVDALYFYMLDTLHVKYRFSTDVVSLIWMEFYADRGMPPPGYSDRGKPSHLQYQWLGNAYQEKAAKENAMRVRLLREARWFYKKSGDLKSLLSVNRKLDEVGKPPHIEDPGLITALCKNYFQDSASALKIRRQYQQKVFASPGRAQSIVADYQRELQRHYQGAGGENITFNFQSVSLLSLMELYFSFVLTGDAPLDQVFSLGESLQPLNVTVNIKNMPNAYAMALILAEHGIKADCSRLPIRFYTDTETVPLKLVISYLVTGWEGEFQSGPEGLNGTGSVEYENALRYQGQVVKNLPDGSGDLSDARGWYREINDNFVAGIAEGDGKILVNGEVGYVGPFKGNTGTGTGRLASESYLYEGELSEMQPHGKGRMEHVVRSRDQQWRPYYSLDEEIDIVSFFEGRFVDGKKQGTGLCGLRKGEVFQEFECEFHQGTLIRMGDISLLPDYYSVKDHSQLY